MLLKLYPEASSPRRRRFKRRLIVQEIKTLAATHFLWKNPNATDTEIAHVIGVEIKTLEKMRKEPIWNEAISWWHGATSPPKKNDPVAKSLQSNFNRAEVLWEQMIGSLPIQDYQKFDHPDIQSETRTTLAQIGVEYLQWRYRLRRLLRSLQWYRFKWMLRRTLQYSSEIMLVCGLFLF